MLHLRNIYNIFCKLEYRQVILQQTLQISAKKALRLHGYQIKYARVRSHSAGSREDFFGQLNIQQVFYCLLCAVGYVYTLQHDVLGVL